jgi:signal transduction histidine kinase
LLKPGPRAAALQIAAAYFAISSAWIILSDRAAARLFPATSDLARASQYKGLAFVTVTTALLYFALRNRLDAIDRSRRAVEESERRFAAFMDNLPVAAFIRDQNGRCVYVNRYWTAHLAAAGIDPPPGDCSAFDPAMAALVGEEHARVLAGEPSAERLIRLEAGGREREYLVRSFPVPSGGDLLVGSFAIDVTEQRQLEFRLHQAAKMEALGLLAGGVAHDFNNVLTVINGHAQILSQHPHDPHSVARSASEIAKAGESASQIIARLLSLSRNQSPQPAPLDLNAAIEAILPLVERLAGNVRLHRDLAPHLPPIRADRGQIDQILLNLIVNARDAMPSGGAVHIATSLAASPPGLDPGNYVLLSVRDEGAGMDDATRARIFEPFFTTKSPGKGTGLGLTTVFSIVRATRGVIDVDSAPGRGATFRIFFPAAAPA